MKPLLAIEDLRIGFEPDPRHLVAVDGVSLQLEAGRTLAVVGESGSGKSVTALSITRLLASPPAAYLGGRIWLEGKDVLGMGPAELRALRGSVAGYVFQDPGACLSPVYRVGVQLREAVSRRIQGAEAESEAVRLLGQVGLASPEVRARQFPHELSGGMQQRVMIAMALAARPKLLVADEPTASLDVTVQAEIVELLGRLQRELGMAMLLITHNLGLVSGLADDLAVLYAGQVVESGPAAALLRGARHPYTRALVGAMPVPGGGARRLTSIPGQVPLPGAMPSGCRFHPRCPVAQPACALEPPPLAGVAGSWQVRCPFAGPVLDDELRRSPTTEERS